MNEKVFLALRNIYEHDEVSNSSIINELINEDYISSDGTSLTQKGINAISPYKVNNAIIMAAGYSARCMPLSNVIPKGLFRIKGDILIEREIEQLIASGITNIIVVIGYLADKFEYLKDKYSNINISLVYNKDYNKYNNIASLFCVKELIGNSYILCSDNYFSENIFHSYVYHSYYSCVYTVEYADEYCVTSVDRENNINGIKRGGSNCWYTCCGQAFL